MVGGRLLERRLGVHPALLIPSIVILTQFGWIWLFIAAPGGLDGGQHRALPPWAAVGAARPAGVLPWDPPHGRCSVRRQAGGVRCARAGRLSIDHLCEVT